MTFSNRLKTLALGLSLFSGALPATAQELACPAGDCAVERREGWINGPEGPVFVSYEIVDGKPVLEGDIVVQPVERVGRAAIGSGIIRTWPGGVMPYEIGAVNDLQGVTEAIAHVNENTVLNLVPRTNEANYVVFEDEVGCWSNVGLIGGRQQISPCDRGAAIHEILHAAGVWHEQSRTDRDNHVIIHYDNITTGQAHNFDKFAAVNGINHGPYDFGSIMHYGPNFFSSNGFDTISPVTPGITLGQRDGLSAGDIAGIAALYTVSPVPAGSEELTNGVARSGLSDGIEGEQRFHIEVPEGAQNLSIETFGGSGDADLYVALDRDPTVVNSDCGPELPSNAERCDEAAPLAGTWRILVRGFEAYDGLTLVATFEAPEAPVAPEGSELLQSGVPRAGLSGAPESEARFHMVVPANATTLQFTLSGGTGEADVYVAFGREPSALDRDYDCGPEESGNEERCDFPAPESGTWHVLVRAYGDFSDVTLVGEHDGTTVTSQLQPVAATKLKVKQGTQTKLVMKAVDGSVFPPALGTPEDPAVSGGRLRLTNPRTGEEGVIELPAGAWVRKNNGTLRALAAGCKVVVKPSGKLNVRCVGSTGGFSLDEASQGELGVSLELGNGAGYCTGFGATPSQDWGVNYGRVAGKGVFGLRGAPRPSECR
ncbi:MAG: M12 family metallopeptidase [Myxococcales bacterium]|nr:M12 family metallopeptidase [Myxococcales bacterium]